MKFKKNKKYLNIAIYSLIVIILSIIFYLVASEVDGVMSYLKLIITIFTPITIGFMMAYLFNFILVLFEDKMLSDSKIKKNLKRVISLMLTYITVAIVFGLFLKFILPQLLSSLVGLANEIPKHLNDLDNIINNISNRFNFDESFKLFVIDEFNKFMTYITTFTSELIPKIGNFTKNIISSIWNIILGLIISAYVLIDKEKFAAQAKKLTTALLPVNAASKTMELVDRANSIFGNFLSGKILDSIIIAILTFITLLIFRMPYAILVSFIIGVTNIVPFFGPFIGAIPAFFIILFVSTQKAFIFLILILIIQQIDGNIIGPKILGSSLGISPFWILFSLLVSGKIFGFIGLIIGVPLFVFFYSIIKDLIEVQLEKKGLPTDTKAYKNNK